MRKLYSLLLRKVLLVLCLFLISQLKAQVTVSTPVPTGVVYVSDTDPGVLIFGVRNTNGSAITITGISAYMETVAGAATYSLWYHPTAVTGAPTAITAANGWIKLTPSGTVTPTSNSVAPIISGLSLTVPANTTYRLALEGPIHHPYYGTSGSTGDVVSNGGLTIYMQGNAASPTYAGLFPTLSSTFTPRSFYGSITFVPVGACTDPPVTGTVVAPATSCIGSTISLDLTGNSIGTGQTYQWETSTDNTNWSNLGTSSTSPLRIQTVTATAYFRVKVTCGATTSTSASVLVTASAPLAGNYTIDPVGSGPNNFTTFGAAVTRLSSCGISAPVTFTVATGTYIEQVTIPQIAGASATNTVTFLGNGATIQFNSTNTNARAGILLNGADNIVIDSLIINGSAGTYCWGVVLTGKADNNIIRKCTINVGNLTSISTNYIGVVLNGSATGTAFSGDNANGNLFENNTINGGYYGFYVYGNSAVGGNNLDNKFFNNTIRDNYDYGLYIIYQGNVVVSGNDISRPLRTSSTTMYGVFLTTNSVNALIEKNRIHNFFDAMTTNTNSGYGVYIGTDGTAGQENKVYNNLIYNIGGNGVNYGIYNTSGDYNKVYHNTVALNDNVSTSGATYGIYQTTAAIAVDYKNNIVTISRSGTGIKRCIYLVTTTSTITSNNNILYMNSATGTNNHLGQFGTINYTTLTDWKTANSSAYDQQSLSLDPQYASPSTGDYQPTNTLSSNTGVNVGVTSDIKGAPRSVVTPDAGAYEFSFLVAGNNMSAEALLSPLIAANRCYTPNETAIVRVRNNGTTTMNFATNPVTLTLNVTGAATQTLSVVINSGTLASDATLDVTLPGVLNMTTAGIYTFNAATSLAGDSNPADDAMQTAERTKDVLSGGAAIVTPDAICISMSSSPVLKTDGAQAGYSSLQWQSSTTAGTGFTNISGATVVPHSLATPISQNMYYRLVATCGSVTANSSEVLLTVNNPQILSATPATRCGPGTVTLSATASPGTDVKWFATPTSMTALATGNSFVTPSLTGTTTYYAAAGSGGSTQTANHGLPTVTTTTQNTGLLFDLNVDVVLTSIDVYPVAAGDVVITLLNSAGTLLYTSPTFTVTAGTIAGPPQTLTLNWPVPAGTNYRMLVPTHTPQLGYHGGTFPILLGNGVGQITTGATATGTTTLNYFIYNMTTTVGCTGARQAVVATINPTAPLDVTRDTVVCNNAITQLTVLSDPTSFTSYIWSPATELFTDAAATIPYAGGSATSVYAKSAVAGKHKYYLNSTNSATTCSNIDSVTITVLPSGLTVTSVQPDICAGKTVTISVPAGDYGTGLQWYRSDDGVAYTPVAGATGISYTSPALSDTTWFKLELRNGAGVVCLQPFIKINVNNPQVLTTTPATRCSPGTLTLAATAPVGTTLSWYENATGGTALTTGNSFTTPSLTTSKTYYVSASSGGGGLQTVGPPDLSIGAATNVSTYYVNFTVLTQTTIQSVESYFTTVGSAFTINIRDATTTTSVFTYSGTTSVSGTTTPQVIPINATLNPGTYQIGWNTDPGAYRNSAGGAYPYTIPGVISITGNTFNDPAFYYYFYRWSIVSGCESGRTAVAATIASPDLNIVQDTLVCNNAITALSVSTPLSNFDSYKWTPATNLYTDAAGTIPYTAGSSATTLYQRSTASGKHKYYINAANSVTTCAAIDSVTVTVLPATLVIGSSRSQICNSGSTTLSIPAGEYGTRLQWLTSTDGTTYTLVAGATNASYTTPVINATTLYKLEIRNGAGALCLQPIITVEVGTPQILTTAPATRCGPGTLALGATVSPAGANVNWYETATGGLPVATGTSFTTPVLNANKTYYAASAFGFSSSFVGRLAPVTPAATVLTTYAQEFTLTQAITLNSVEVISAGGTSITVSLYDATGNTQLQTTGPLTVVANSTYTVNLGWALSPGTYRLAANGMTGNFMRENSSVTYPFPLGTVGQVNGFVSAINGALTTTASYYWFYNWQISSGCESPRTAVIATVTPAPAFDVAKDSLICNNAVTALSVVSSISDFNTYKWSPATDLYTDAAATVPYTAGSSATTVYAKVGTAGIRKYYITANNTTSGCQGIDSVKLTVLPATLTIAASRGQICNSGSTTLSLPSGEYGTAALQWYTSPDGVAYSLIAGATTSSYTTPTLTSTTYYKVDIRNGAGGVCTSPTITVGVGVPAITATAPSTRCDPGTVTIGATPGPAGATVNWYAAATGGLPIATGNTYTTPVLNATTTYYAASGFGFTSSFVGRLAPVTPAGTVLSTYGQDFTLTQAITLNSVQVISAGGTSITVSLYDATGNTQLQTTGALTVPANATYTVNLGWNLAPGTYRLAANAMTGNFMRENSSVTYPFPLGTVGQVNGFVSAINGTVTTSASYYWFYNWNISTGCESARVPVDAIINGSINIDADPIDKALCTTGQEVILSVTARGAITTYQWRKGGINIPGANAPIYTIPAVGAADAGDYDVVITGPCSTATSAVATISISAPAAVTTDPVAQQKCIGGTVSFITAATGTGPLGYQWRKNGTDIVGAYGTTFTINNITAADFGSYDVIVTGSCTKDTSLAATLTVAPSTTVATQPVPQTVCAGNNVTFISAGSGSGTLRYQWRKAGVDILNATSATFTITGVATSDAGNYDVVITGDCGSVTSSIAGLTVNAATAISAQPLSQSICLGSNVQFSVTTTGSGTLTYQWRKGGTDIPGAIASSYTINGVTAANVGNYDVRITASCGSVLSSVASLTISAPGSWIGVANSDWNNAANWCGTIPTSTTDVTIPSSAPNMPILSNGGSARNITIQNGGSLTVANSGTLNLYGNLTGAGQFIPTNGTVAFRGATAQSAPAFTATNVIMNGTGGFALSGNTTVTGALSLTNGNITLGSNNLSLAAGSTGSTNSHVITNGSGSVIATGFAASSTRIIPVGTSAASYTPVILTANTGHVTDNLSIRVQPQVLSAGTTGGRIDEFVVDRTWLITEAVPGGSNVNVTFQWNEGEELPEFGRNESYVIQYTGAAWVTGVEALANGSNPYTQTKTNVTSFAPFAVQTDPLPTTSVGVYPNPTRGPLTVIVRTNAPAQLTINVYDMAGKLVKTQVRSVGFGGTLLPVDVTELSAGLYIMKISTPTDKEFFVRKFMKAN
jgi:hypothetical protein